MSFNKKTIKDIDVRGKTVLLRTDYNVTLNSQGQISDDYRIRMTLPTIEHLIGLGAKVIILSHIGRPNGKKDPNLSLMPVATKLSDLLHLQVRFIPKITAKDVKTMIDNIPPASVVVLENLRFCAGEESNDVDFSKFLASLGEIFVQDGFAVAYREHAGIVGIAKLLPAVGGLLLEKEMLNLTDRLENADHPVGLIIGGIKVADKLPVTENFLTKSDFVAVGGVVANTLLAAKGINIGSSLIDDSCLDSAKRIIGLVKEQTVSRQFSFMLPRDVVVAKDKQFAKPIRVVDLDQHTWSDITSYPKKPSSDSFELDKTDKIFDIGPISAARICGALNMSKLAIWCGPLGSVEIKCFNQTSPPFSHGSRIVAENMVGEQAGYKNRPCSIVGGGNTIAMLNDFGIAERFDFLSTGGGACLQVLAGKSLPGVDVLLNKDA